ncbi:hypothetical protein GUITHDRAFT_44852, partial [Guillardia theta CCMP2712]
MGWQDDHMWVSFPKSKTDQTGERKEPKSIYANPICPEICPILALGIYLLSHTPDRSKLFPGNVAIDGRRYEYPMIRKAVCREITRLGMNREDIGTHSIRKGAATYCTSGSTHCP